MPFDYGLRPNNRQRIANARETPIEANKNQSVDGAEGLFLGSGAPQNVYLLPQRQNFSLERCPRPKQISDHPNNEPDNISHPATASPDSRSAASQIEFATGTPPRDISRSAEFDSAKRDSNRDHGEKRSNAPHPISAQITIPVTKRLHPSASPTWAQPISAVLGFEAGP
jgi:hypothetical protein